MKDLIVPEAQTSVAVYSNEFIDRINSIGDSIVAKRKEIQVESTPANKIYKMGDAKSKPKVAWDDLNYVKEDYLKELLNKHFKGLWNWVAVGQGLQVFEHIGQCAFTGTLEILENGFLRKFSACGGSAIKVKKGEPPSSQSIVRFGNDVKSANTDAFKKAIHMLTDACYDVYGKDVVVDTNPEQLTEMSRLYPLMNKEKAEQTGKYVQSEFGGWEHIPFDIAAKIIVNMTEISNLNKKQEELTANYEQSKQQY